ncbi:MAG: DUF1634 domain-containing protein [Planctomycetes bacterium]|nr:DUF1634 domain-containing protein [Planctomycetota bacterium]
MDETLQQHAVGPPKLEAMLSRVLSLGVYAAAGMAVLGGVVYLVQHGGETVSYTRFDGEPGGLTNPAAIVSGALGGDGRAMVQASVLILIATPIIRVLASLVLFMVTRDRLYVAVTLLVLVLLCLGLWGAIE